MTAPSQEQPQTAPNSPWPQSLEQRHIDVLRMRSITPSVAQARGYYSASTADLTDLQLQGYPLEVALPALAIPTWNVAKRECYQILRPDHPRTNKDGDPVKYERPPNSQSMLDVAPAMQQAISDVTVPLHITEGPIKADSLAAQGLCAADIFGCWSFRTRISGSNISVVVSDFLNIPLVGRSVYICFDSDAATNQHVADAEKELARYLSGLGADVYIVRLPNTYNGAKVGIDDYFAAGHTKDDYLALAVPFSTKAIKNALNDLPLTDIGNAESMALLYGDTMRYTHDAEKWFLWDGVRWKEDKLGLIDQRAKDTVRQRQISAMIEPDNNKKMRIATFGIQSENNRSINNMIKRAESEEQFRALIEQFDKNNMLIGVRNGTVDLSTGYLIRSNQDDYITKQMNVFYSDGATCPTWELFLDQLFNGDKDLIKYLQKALGYSLTGDTSEEKIFMLIGEGSNGKSTLLRVILDLLGDYAGNTRFDTFDDDKSSKIGEDIAALRGNRFISVLESKKDLRLDEQRIKYLTGRDPITCRFLHGNPFTYEPNYKLWLGMNDLPVIKGTENGTWRRIVVIRFNQIFSEELGNIDPYLDSKLAQESSGILNWLIEGVKLWKKERLGSCAAIDRETAQYRAQSDVIGRFVSTYYDITKDETDKEATSSIYHMYSNWAEDEGIKYKHSKESITRYLTKRGVFIKTARLNGVVQRVAYGIARAQDTGVPDA